MIDRILLRNILNAHSKTGLEWIYAECGKLSLKYIIQTRRLMYLWHVLHRDKTELINRIYLTQKNQNNIGDWTRLVEADKSELEINLTDQEIQGVTKNVFKNYVKRKVIICHLRHLEQLKRKHSKSKYLQIGKLKPAEYMESPVFSTFEKRLLFKLRSRTIEVKQNFPSAHRNPWCKSCGLFPESQSHLLQCPALVVKLNYLAGKTANLNENFIYGNLKQQQIIVKIFSDILEVRDNLQMEIRARD